MIAYRVQYKFAHVHARIPNGHPREDPREEKRACRTSRRTSRRGSLCVSASLQAERGSRWLPDKPTSSRRSSRESRRVGVGVRVVPWNSSTLVALLALRQAGNQLHFTCP